LNQGNEFAEGDFIVTQEQAVFEVIDRGDGTYAISSMAYFPCRGIDRRAVVPKNGPLLGESLLRAGEQRFFVPYKPHYVSGAYVLPLESVRLHEMPEVRAKELFFGEGEIELRNLLIKISAGSAVPPFSIGVGGSTLIGLRDEIATLIIYGIKQNQSVWDFLKYSDLSPLSLKKELVKKKSWMDDQAFELIMNRKWDIGKTNGIKFRIRGVLPRGEDNGEKSKFLYSQAPVEGEAKIVEDRMGRVFPARYSVKGDVDQIIIYDQDLIGLAEENETVKYRGKLEVFELEGRRVKKLLIGSKWDYFMPLQAQK